MKKVPIDKPKLISCAAHCYEARASSMKETMTMVPLRNRPVARVASAVRAARAARAVRVKVDIVVLLKQIAIILFFNSMKNASPNFSK